MSDFAAWTGEAPDAAEDAVVAPPPGSWLPPSVAARHETEDRAEARRAREEKRAREAAAGVRHDQAVGAYIAGAAMRGEVVSALDILNGTIGRSLEDVLAGARESDAIMGARRERSGPRGSEGNPEILNLEPVTALAVGEAPQARRSGGYTRPPLRGDSTYGLDRMMEQAEDDRRWMTGYMARHRYPEAEAAARAKAERGRVSRSGSDPRYDDPQYVQHYGQREIRRVCGPGEDGLLRNYGYGEAIR